MGVFNPQHGESTVLLETHTHHVFSSTPHLKQFFFFLPVRQQQGQTLPKSSVQHFYLEKQRRVDIRPNWFQGMKTCPPAKKIWLVPVPVMTRRQGYRTKMIESHFIPSGLIFFLSLSYQHILAATVSLSVTAYYCRLLLIPEDEKLTMTR